MSRVIRIALAGHRGFLGRAVLEGAGSGFQLSPVEIRIGDVWRADLRIEEAVDLWLSTFKNERKRLVGEFSRSDVVVNVAGLALPGSRRHRELFEANAVLPGVLGALAQEAGVRRLVHVSTAAVQGRRQTLDETPEVEPLTPYASSKAAGEEVCTSGNVPMPDEVVIYRPTSIMAAGSLTTRRLIRVASWRFVPMAGDGTDPVPVCLSENVAAGILHAATVENCPAIVLQPWEGITTRLLWELFGQDPSFFKVPRAPLEMLARAASSLGSYVPSVSALGRRAEVLLLGQRQRAQALESTGFEPPAGPEVYRCLAKNAGDL